MLETIVIREYDFLDYPENKPSNKQGKGKVTVLCKCPNWCSIGYQIAEYSQKNERFDYDDAPNDMFHDNVEGFIVMDID